MPQGSWVQLQEPGRKAGQVWGAPLLTELVAAFQGQSCHADMQAQRSLRRQAAARSPQNDLDVHSMATLGGSPRLHFFSKVLFFLEKNRWSKRPLSHSVSI